jgi:hypothetical protein
MSIYHGTDWKLVRFVAWRVEPTAKVTDEKIMRIVRREFGDSANEVYQKLTQVVSDSPK